MTSPRPLHPSAGDAAPLFVLASHGPGWLRRQRHGTAPPQQGVPKGQTAVDNSTYSGGEATPPKPAPALELKNSLGEPVDLAEYKGKAVLLTFIYTHCPDVCPLIVSHLKTAQAELGREGEGPADRRRLDRPARRHAEDGRRLPRRTRDDRARCST